MTWQYVVVGVVVVVAVGYACGRVMWVWREGKRRGRCAGCALAEICERKRGNEKCEGRKTTGGRVEEEGNEKCEGKVGK